MVVCKSRKMVTFDVISMAAAHQPCWESGVFTDYAKLIPSNTGRL